MSTMKVIGSNSLIINTEEWHMIMTEVDQVISYVWNIFFVLFSISLQMFNHLLVY